MMQTVTELDRVLKEKIFMKKMRRAVVKVRLRPKLGLRNPKKLRILTPMRIAEKD